MYFKVLLLFLLGLSLPAFAQIQFEKGYFINLNNERIECLIRNVEWDNNPRSFKYKIQDGPVEEGQIDAVKEFGLMSGLVYKSAKVKIDQSSTNLSMLSKERNPEWSEQSVFLKTLVNGPVKLFLFRESGVSQFLYQKNDSLIVSLISKRYYGADGQPMYNAGFRQQLLNDVRCGNVGTTELSRISYKESDLIRYFNQYNGCADKDFKVEKKVTREAYNVKITPGADFTMLAAHGFTFLENSARKHNSTSFRLGVEGEYIAPFNKGKWSVVAEPAFQYYKSPLWIQALRLDVDYWSLELPFGIRHYFFLPGKSKIFVNGLFVLSCVNKQTGAKGNDRKFEVNAGSNFAGGVGFARGKFSAELRYIHTRDVTTDYVKVDADYKKLSLILGYKIFSR